MTTMQDLKQIEEEESEEVQINPDDSVSNIQRQILTLPSAQQNWKYDSQSMIQMARVNNNMASHFNEFSQLFNKMIPIVSQLQPVYEILCVSQKANEEVLNDRRKSRLGQLMIASFNDSIIKGRQRAQEETNFTNKSSTNKISAADGLKIAATDTSLCEKPGFVGEAAESSSLFLLPASGIVSTGAKEVNISVEESFRTECQTSIIPKKKVKKKRPAVKNIPEMAESASVRKQLERDQNKYINNSSKTPRSRGKKVSSNPCGLIKTSLSLMSKQLSKFDKEDYPGLHSWAAHITHLSEFLGNSPVLDNAEKYYYQIEKDSKLFDQHDVPHSSCYSSLKKEIQVPPQIQNMMPPKSKRLKMSEGIFKTISDTEQPKQDFQSIVPAMTSQTGHAQVVSSSVLVTHIGSPLFRTDIIDG